MPESSPAGWFRGVTRISDRLQRPRRTQQVSVVLTGRVADAASLADALASLAAQERVVLEVLLAPWGTGNQDVLQAVADLAPIDVQVCPVSPTGNDARNAGALLAAGEHLIFLDPLVRLRPGALHTLVEASATERGYRVVRATSERNPFNPASYLFSAAYWADAGLDFDAGHGDFPEATCARVLGARPVRVDARLWDRVPRAGAATGAMASWSDTIDDWLAMVPTVRQLVTGPEKAQWIRDLLVSDLPGLLADAERLPYAILPELADVVGAVLAALPPNDLARVPVEPRAAAWLGGQAHWTQLAELMAGQSQHDGQFPTRVEGTRIHAELPGVDWQALHTPPQMLEVGLEETSLTGSVRRVRWVEEPGPTGAQVEMLAVDVFAFIRHVTLSNPTIQARWVGQSGRSGPTVPAVVRRRVDPHVGVVSAQRYQDQSQGSVTVLTPISGFGPGSWYLEVAITQGAVVRTGRLNRRDQSGSAGSPRPSPGGEALPVWDPSGLRLDVSGPGSFPRPSPPALRVARARREDDWLALDLTGAVRAKPVLQSRTTSPATTLVGHVDGNIVRFQLVSDRFGTGVRPAPSGHYRLLVGGKEVPWDDLAGDEIGFDLIGPEHRICARRTSRGGVAIDLRPPLRDDEIGAFARGRLLTAYDVQRPLVDAVLIESSLGRACTGSPLAIDRELARSHPELTRVWVVEDRSVAVPDGAMAVLRNSRAWYDALARSRWLVVDGDLPPFFSRRASQEVLQTLSGYPARTMGVDTWLERNYAARRIDHLLEHSSRQWSALLAPGLRLEHWFRESFRYEGTLLPTGLPRTDLLVGPDAAERRALTRNRLGIPDDQVVVFYAPEPGAHPVFSVRPRELMDVAELSAALGPGHTLLLVAASPGQRPPDSGGARVVDVTGHPRPADLMLASDAAVFDYSALRFDYALTGRPMVFQVPDPSVRRGDARGFLFPYIETAPGPMAATVTDVVTLLADLDGLQRRQLPALARFNTEFNDMADGSVAARVVAELFGPERRHAALAQLGPAEDAYAGPERRRAPGPA